uniref:Uncharacterized protein n=1 Tax=Anopheles atroparvus TaxID=41427 RepID=A0AAG5CRU3_ANOAO
MVAECLRQDGYSPDRPEELSIASEKSDPDGKDFIKKEEILVVDTRKSSLSAIEASGMDDDSPLLTDFTTSSITYVSDRIDSSSFELMVGDTSLDFLKVGITAGFVASDDKKHDVQSPGSCMSFTTTTSENIESITHDVEKLMFTGGSLYPEAPTEYERSVSLSDNAASDYSNESATKYNLPYDTESDGHEPVASMARLKTLKSREGPIELKHVKPTKLMSVDHRHESASPQSDITEYTESVSYVDSIIDSTNYESALKIETSEVTQSPEEEVEIKEQPNLKTAEHELKRVSDKYPTRTVEAKTMIEPIESTQVKRRPKSKATVTKVSLQKQTPIDISKRSAKSVDIRASSGETTRLSETKSAIVSSRGTTTTRTHGYMQSTLSRDQKVLRPLNLADSTHSSPSKSSYRSYSASASATLQTSNSSAVHSIERKIKSTKDTHSVKSGVQEQQPKPPNFSVGAKKETKESTSSTAKTISARSTSSTVSGASTSISHRASRSTTISARKLSEKSDRKEPAVVKKSDKEQANMVTKSTLPAAVKTSKDRVNKSLIPVKVQGKRDSTPSPNKTPKSKSKKETAPKTIEAKMSKHIEKLEQTTDKKETTVVQLITKSVPRVTNTARKESAKHATDDVYRCKSAMHYSYKDAVTFDHAEVPSSLPSSPSRLNKSSSNSTNVLTSEVFTRTIDSSKSIEVIYKQPSTSHELYRRVNEYRYNDIDMTFIETTDSSLSDSIALPSSSSEQESDAANKLKQSGSPGSPKQTSSSSAVTTMTTLTNKKDQHPSPHVRPSKPTSAGKRARTHSPAEPKYRKSDIWSRTEPPASSQELPDTSEDSDMYYYHHQQYQLQHQQQQQQQHQLPPMIGHADRRLTTSLDGIVLESCISPILDFRASTPPRMKYKFDYDSSMFTDTFTERDDALQTSAKLEGDEYLVLVQSEAGRLVDSVLEQSVSIVNSSQPGPMTIDRDLQAPSDSEQYAIRSDILSSTDGDLVVKSPTIESMSGKSFDDNMSNPEYDALLHVSTAPTAGGVDVQPVLPSSLPRDVQMRDGEEEEDHDDDGNGDDEDMASSSAVRAAGDNRNISFAHGEVEEDASRQPEDPIVASQRTESEAARRAKKIDRKYARLSSELGPEVLLDKNQEYDDAISQIKDEVSMLQSEYSKMSWDESVSVTTGDFGSSTPDNDLQETDTQLQTEINMPMQAPRLQTITVEAGPVEDASEASASATNASTNIADATTSAAADAATVSFVSMVAVTTSVETKELTTTTTSSAESAVASSVIAREEHSTSITSTEPEKPSDSSSCEGQPVPKPRTSISSRTDTATRSSLLESFEHQDSIEQYPEPVVQPTESDRFRQGSIASDDLSHVAQKDSSEMVTSEEDISTGAKFFIGECSSDIITRTTADKRSEYAFDNDGYTFSQDSQGTEDDSQRNAFEAYQQQIKQEDGFTLDSLKEMDMEMKSATKPPVVHSPVAPLAQSTSVESTQVEQTEATTTDSVAQSLQMTIDELAIEKTLEEVKESLDAVQEELEAVTDGTPIKQSPSEFEFKILPSTRYVQDPIYETNQEEAMAVSTATSAAITTTTIVSDSAPVEPEPKTFPTPPPIKIDEAGSGTGGSSDSSQAKLDVSPRMRKGPHGTQVKGSRWSATDVDSSGESHYQSFEHTDSSRPHSSDIENVMPYASSEYETALDHSMVRTSTGTEYHSAASTLNSYQVSSHDSMKSFDSESSGNLASIESEATETLVPSTMDVDFDSSDAALIHDDSEDDLRDKLLLLDDREELSSATSSIPIAMKRSHEMDFAELAGGDSMGGDDQARQLHEELPDEKLLSSSIGTARDLVESMQASSMEDVKTEGADEMKLGTSMEDGSILSISLSSASNLETIMENLSEKTAAQNVPTHAEIGLDAVTPSTSGAVGFIGDITLTSTVLTEGDVNFLNTQATTEIFELAAGASTREEGEETVRKRGHKRTESTAIISGKFMAEMGENRDSIESQDESLSQEASKQSSSERDETRDESSDSDYDRYESEYARSFRAPVVQPKKKDKKAADVFEKDFGELDRRNSFSPSQSVIETIVEDVHAEIEQSDEAQRIMASKSQRLQEYRESSTHNIPDIHVTEDIAADSASLELEDVVKETSTPAPSTQPSEPVATSSVSTVDEVKKSEAAPSTSRVTEKQTSVQYAKQEEYQLTEEQYHELIEQKYKAKLADSTTKYGFDADDKDDSAGSDSFEMLEQPDISDEFVIVEEVAREAHEFDSEGKSVAIKPTKIEKKHDEDVEKMLVKSAPAHTNAGSLYAANMRDDMMYEFEESPPTGGEDVDAAAGVTMDLMNNGFPLEESKRWVEMQLAETQNFRYPYEDRLEDIKEEDTDFEVGSSRIGSIKDSFSSTPDYDLLAKRMASREHDDISMSSLQEFENLEHVISLENRKMQQGSQDSLSNGSFTRRFVQRGAHGDDISLSSLKEFEGLENACIEAHLIEIKAKEEAALLLSRSDESNKSDRSNGAKRSPPRTGGPVAPGDSGNGQSVGGGSKGHVLASTTTTTTTILGGPSDVTTVKVEKRTSSDVSRDSLSGATTTTTTITTISHESQVRQALEEEDSSHLLTVSSDSLDGTKAPKVTPSARDTLPSAHSSSDSLDINNRNVDVMTSSIDSIEFSKTGIATTRSSQSDSIEHMLGQQQPHRSDSTDSIEAHQQQLQHKLLQQQQQQSAASQSRTLSDAKRDSLESLACSSDNQSGFSSPTKSAHGTQRGLPEVTGTGVSDVYQPTMQLHTQAIPSASVGGAMQKDISADSLTGPDAAFLTSTESLETSSTATNATYQNETDSQMSSSVTSCDSITMVDTVVPHGTIGDFDVFGSSAVGFGGSTMTTSMSAAYASVTGSFGSSSTTTANVTSSSTSQQQQVFRSSHVAGAVSSSTVTSAVSSSTSAYRMQQQQMMGEIELLSSEMFPGDIAFDDVKETAKERMQSKSTEKED